VLSHLPEHLSAYATRTLESMGVTVRPGMAVTAIDERGVEAGGERIEAATVIWGAGVKASPAAAWLGAEADRAGRVKVERDLLVPGHPDIFVIGDTAAVTQDGKPVPGVASAAQQMAAYVVQVIRARLADKPSPGPFTYYSKGELASIGRRAAIVRLGGLVLTGFIGWLFWSLLHIYFLITLRNRIAVAFTWAWDYVTFGRRARLITHVPGPSG
jgi:NADH dehydrogenase